MELADALDITNEDDHRAQLNQWFLNLRRTKVHDEKKQFPKALSFSQIPQSFNAPRILKRNTQIERIRNHSNYQIVHKLHQMRQKEKSIEPVNPEDFKRSDQFDQSFNVGGALSVVVDIKYTL